MSKNQGNPADQTPEENYQAVKSKKSSAIWIGVAILITFGAIIAGIVILSRSDPATTSHIRDIFIIVLALEALIIGVAMVILVVQLALLMNLLQNEIKPILETTHKTVDTLKGTSAFLSKHAVKPVMKISSLAAGARKLIEIIGIIKK